MELITKLSKAKTNFEPIKKEATNPHYKNKYMTLDDIVASITDALAKEGLVLYHSQTESGLKTILTDGKDSIESFYPIRSGLTDQQLGSSLTYGRRYSICCLLGIVADEDDDGNKASQPTTPQPKKQDKTPAEILDAFKAKLAESTTFEEVKKLSDKWESRKFEWNALNIYLKGTEAIDKRLGEIK